MEYRYMNPVEMPRSSHYGNSYLIIPSRKLSRNVTAFSNLEYKNILSLEMDPKVIFFCEQPLTTEVYLDGMRHTTTFDCYVVYSDGTEEMQEVKYTKDLEDPGDKGTRCRIQIEAQRSWCRLSGMQHAVRTEKILDKGQFTSRNIAFLAAKAARYTATNALARKVVSDFLKENGPRTVGQLSISGALGPNGLDLLADMCYRGEISFTDIDTTPISNRSEVAYGC